tara:strand:+ start:72 stop:317 length:246 start_codon:yes stop_codon:yes gene_type:complete
MEIFLLISIIILVIFFIFKTVLSTAKRNLFKDQAAWSGKDIKIKYNKTQGISNSKSNENYLKIIAEESRGYLEDQNKRAEE